MRDVEQESRRRGNVVLVAPVLMLVPMLRSVPVVQRSRLIRVDLPREEMQVFSRCPVGMDPRGHPTECRSKEQTRQQDDEEEERPP